MKKIISVIGARPNFMKIAPLCRELKKYPDIEHILVHTGQHYDDKMSQSFFRALNIPEADINLGIGSGSHAEQVGKTMIAFEKVLQQERPDWVIVVGDVNATCACSITARKENVRVAHIEAGLRSFDMGMPEEINRLVTDRLADLLFTPDNISGRNLRNEGTPEEKIKFVGNIMIDTLERERNTAQKLEHSAIIGNNLADGSCTPEIHDGNFAVLTMHRPSNVDSGETLEPLIRLLTEELSAQLPLLWSLHPRTRKQLERFGLWEKVVNCSGICLLQPLGYHEMLKLNMAAKVFLTDSGGLQEECCVLGTPCITMRFNTERPITLTEHGGVSVLTGNNVQNIRKAFSQMLNTGRRTSCPELWDGNTAVRIVDILQKNL
ncbi:MAG: UDP-N-acetylglucosamine 2-epimerase (non-hydrolyzing) [Victivallales bacterium]|nr:UDP-N-acetylglucosamine 2-epimerase (non-hydrolyzing) [Victivallales bacterium]